MKDLRVAAIQMVSSTRPEHNAATMKKQVAQAAQAGADWVVLPEYWPIMGEKDTDKLAFAEQYGDGPLQQALKEAAQENGVVIFGGTIPLQSPQSDKVINTLLIYGRDGEVLGRYDKMHLFGFSGLGERFDEADTILAGNELPHCEIEGIRVGLGICYDLRFPEFFRAQGPFDIMILPAAFTFTTGQAHWALLLRTRAVENQCYLIASAQGGKHESGRTTYGHSMIIDPWGEVVAQLPEGEGVVSAELSKARLEQIRSRLPALGNRRL